MNKSIYIVLSRTGTLFSNVIAFVTKDEYSHVSISLDPSFKKMYSFGRLIPEKPYPGGFVIEDLYGGVFSLFPKSKCLIYKVDVTEDQYATLKDNISEFVENKDKYSYHLVGTLRLYFNRPSKNDYKYFCSQFVSEMLISSGILSSDNCPELIKHMDLLELENKTLIYDGLILDSTFDGNYNRQAIPSYSYRDEIYARLLWMFGKVKDRLWQF